MDGPSVNSMADYSPSAPRDGANAEGSNGLLDFHGVIGKLPLRKPNVRGEPHTSHDLYKYLNKPGETNPLLKMVMRMTCAATGLGLCYLCSKQVLIKEGQYGFNMNNGVPEILLPGRHLLSSPVNSLQSVRSSGDDRIEVGPISIIRVQQGHFGFAMNDGEPEVLLPGLHVRNKAAFKFAFAASAGELMTTFGPVKIFLVRSGTTRVCYNNGKVQIFKEGRYAVNEGTFVAAEIIKTVQQNVRFERHPVLLDGGISMFVEGLLTFQVIDVERLITELGDSDLLHTIKDITKAELARVFSGIHLEQVASSHSGEQAPPTDANNEALLGKKSEVRAEGSASTRTIICDQVLDAVRPMAEGWGVRIINFQLESTKIADQKYAMEYEEASLSLAKAKANRRAIEAQNEILLQKASAAARALNIEAEGKKSAVIIEAHAEAEAMRIKAKGRNDAAHSMEDQFARQLQLSQQQVEFAASLKATHLTVLPDSAVGRPVTQMLGK
jgi:regulator of protease activity HflC (stomatin/prohibitin superfamily)